MNVRYRPRRRRVMSEINIVPYVDVMLVLLVIFMVTAPLLIQGVSVELPNVDASVIESPAEPDQFTVLVDAEGRLYLNENKAPSNPAIVRNAAAAALAHRDDTRFYVEGDRNANYGAVMNAMVLLQQAGVTGIGLVTEPPSEPRSR